jgi:RNA-binding protein
MAVEMNPLIQIGRDGGSDSVIKELDSALEAHELVKVKILQNANVDKDSLATDLANGTGAEVAQIIGNTILLYRRATQKPIIELP